MQKVQLVERRKDLLQQQPAAAAAVVRQSPQKVQPKVQLGWQLAVLH
jgi:hypothetical protein